MSLEISPLMDKIVDNSRKKIDLLETSPSRYIYRSMLACMYLTLGTAISVIIADKVDHFAPGLGKTFYGFLFSLGLLMIVYMNAELGTSNMMYMSASVYKRVFSPWKALKLLMICVLFNFIGAFIASFLVSQTTIFQNLGPDHFLILAVNAKLVKDPLTIFIEGIFANIIVNTAVFCTLKMKDDAGKVLAILFIVFIFAYLGFEHVIANFSSFTLAAFSNWDALTNLSIGSVLSNFFFAFLGNFVGGGLVIGVGYAWLNSGKSIYKD